MSLIPWEPTERRITPAARCWGTDLREPRQGICLHYDGSSSDTSGLAWLTSPDVRASYHLLVMDDGSWARLAPLTARAWHVGVARPGGVMQYRDANSALYGIAVLNSGVEAVSVRQLMTVGWLARRLYEREGWSPSEDWRITSHSAEAWPRGRKTDPEGADPLHPILSPADVRTLVGLFRAVPPL